MFKTICALLLLFSCYNVANGKCTNTGITCWPGTKTLNQNPVIMIGFYMDSQPVARGLNKKHRVYLRSATETIPLTILETCVGEFFLTQVMLKPAIPLIAGHEYELVIDSLSRYDGSIRKWDEEAKRSESAKWIVKDEKDLTAPKFITTPTENKKTLVEYGCGPAKWVYFKTTIQESAALLVKATVRTIKTGWTTSFYLHYDGKNIILGHGMCSGGFYFQNDGVYEVQFSIMDASGNYSKLSQPVQFTRPTEPTSEE